MKVFVYSIVIVFILAGCHAQQKLMDSWVGDTKQHLVLKWGPPARKESDENGGQIYIYESRTMAYNVVRYNHRMFYINDRDKIYHWRTASGPIPAQQLDVRLYIR